MKKRGRQELMEESTTSITDQSDIYQQLLDAAPQHLGLCQTAATIRTIIESKSLSFTPVSYLSTIIDTFKATHDAELLLLLEFVLTRVPTEKLIDMPNLASEAAKIVFECLQVSSVSVRVRSLVNCLVVLLKFCDSDDVQKGFDMLIKYSMDKRPKVRKCAQDCVVKVIKSFKYRIDKESESKLVLESFKTHWLLAVERVVSRSANGSKDDQVSKSLHILDLLKIMIPCLPSQVISQVIEALDKSLSSELSPLRMHVLDVMEEILGFFESESEHTFIDSVIIATKWNHGYTLVIVSIAGLLTCDEATTAKRASNILKKKIQHLAIFQFALFSEDVTISQPEESNMVRSLFDALDQAVSTNPNEHSLAVISALFLNLGIFSRWFSESILGKLASFMRNTSGDVKHVRECIGCAVVAMGPGNVVERLPISVDLSCSNAWLIRIFKDYVTHSSFSVFIDTIVPLAESFQEACKKENPVFREHLESHARGCWGLLPAFCRYPTDMHENFGSLAKLMIPCIEKDEFMLENIAIALQHLVKQNKHISFHSDDEASKIAKYEIDDETATINIKALSSCSEELLKAFTKVFFQLSPEKRAFVKDTIGCLALITESSKIKATFWSLLENLSLDKTTPSNQNALILELASSFVGEAINSIDSDRIYDLINKCLQEEDDNIHREAYACLYKILEQSSEFRSSKFDQLTSLLLDLNSHLLDITSLRWRFSCFKTLLVHSFEITCDGDNSYGFRMLKEIIVTLRDSKKESRQVAHDLLLDTSSILQSKEESKLALDNLLNTRSIFQSKTGPYHQFIKMIMRYLSGSNPDIKSCAVSALSSLISNDSKICCDMPNLLPAIRKLLDTEPNNMQVLHAVLNFIEVLVLYLQVRDLNNFLPYIMSVLIPWSSVSQHHLFSNMTSILEIMVRKCDSELVNSLVHVDFRYLLDNVLENRPSSLQSPIDFMHVSPEEEKEEEKEEEEEDEDDHWM